MATHVSLLVPEGHTIQVHPLGGTIGVPSPQGIVPNEATAGAKAAMDAALSASEPKPKKASVAKAARKGAGSESGKAKATGAKLTGTST
jgi:hypothetical protein